MKKLLLLLIFLFFITEIALRVDGRLKTYTEKVSGVYVNPYSIDSYKTIYTFNPNQTFDVGNAEYLYPYSTNSIGLLHQELRDADKKNKVVFLGDSFTFGMGAPIDSSFVSLLQNKTDISLPDCGLQMLNAGMPGSDPFFQYKLMQEIYMPAGYRHFVFVMNVSDLYDYIFRGGLERFGDDNLLIGKSAPWIEPIYKWSFILRGIVHGILKMDYSLLSPSELFHQKKLAIYHYTRLFEKIQDEINQVNGTFAVILHPYPAYFNKSNKLKNQVMDYSYLELFYNELSDYGSVVFNLEPKFNESINSKNYLQYGWEQDGHFNSEGYQLFAQILHNELQDFLESLCENQVVL